MTGDKKECFGIEFYPHLSQIEYCGCYCDNERHGFGMLYNRKGELLYEGDWFCGTSDYEKNVLLKDFDDEKTLHSLIHELVIAEGYGNEMKDDLELCGFENLESIVVKKDSLKNLNSVKVFDNPVLKSIETENGEWNDGNATGAFYDVKNVTITSVMIIDWLI